MGQQSTTASYNNLMLYSGFPLTPKRLFYIRKTVQNVQIIVSSSLTMNYAQNSTPGCKYTSPFRTLTKTGCTS